MRIYRMETKESSSNKKMSLAIGYKKKMMLQMMVQTMVEKIEQLLPLIRAETQVAVARDLRLAIMRADRGVDRPSAAVVEIWRALFDAA